MRVFPEWMDNLPMQQQSVLLLAARGPDGIGKRHPCKDVVRAYRGTVLKAAYYGRELRWGEKADSFMSLDLIADTASWMDVKNNFFDSIDELPHHYIMHLAHGVQILGYKHPNILFRDTWWNFYEDLCFDQHMNIESEQEMDARLSDWDEENWEPGLKIVVTKEPENFSV